ncbi:ABC transporter permease [Salinicoccus hispanicus]|uniref:ABC transporter permease subunit n=1 Tax=Salinicoccus hispanicus TaxID=157225 RepID=A0A6N8U245_9STAP|nr:ABC transporter permease [Salinicoccus hispanicus]MXQ49749.1 ABC transporter permease subunit [Salinicoccus hispanicus]
MKMLGRSYMVIIFICLYLPIAYLIFYSFNSGGTMTNFDGFTLEHYKSVFTDRRLIVILLNTVAVALISAGLATLIGIGGAIGLYNIRMKRLKQSLLSLNNVMIVSPDVIIGASLLILFTVLGISLGAFSVILAHIAFSVPIVVLMILPKLQDMNASYLDAARDLGANSFDVLWRVIIPHIKPGILAGFFMALTYSLDDFAVTFFVTGGGFSVLSVEIYAMARRGISLEINAISTLVFLVVLLIALGYYFITTRPSVKRGGIT